MVDEKRLANAIRALSMDAVQQANSGHPGMPMGMADIAQVLWRKYLRHNPKDPNWPDRDRFILSNGHGSMLLYSLLHLTGYDLSIEEIKNFRQLGSKTAGHPEYHECPGVETTTGPLGQGLANAVGMAIAEKTLAAQFNHADLPLVDHRTYVFVGDGCLMEGISHEVCALAGTLKLGKLIVFYDDNGISIDGEVAPWFSDDTVKRFESYGWQVIANVEGHNSAQIDTAIQAALSETDKPTLICCKTTIGYGAPNKAGKESCHGAPLGTDEIQGAREKLGWHDAPFEIPQEIYESWDAVAAGQQRQRDWQAILDRYQAKHPQQAAEFSRRLAQQLGSEWGEKSAALIADMAEQGADMASRKASQMALNAFGELLPELFGGSADLTGSNLTAWQGSVDVNTQPAGNYLYYGVREFGMAAIMNGIALHRGLIPYGGTFLVFSDYARNALRMAALMSVRSIFVFTHDSIGLGEDGPTHQPVEHLSSLRVMPNMTVWRPCDAVESFVAWKSAIEHQQGPSSLIFSRQTLAHQPRTAEQLANIHRGGYILKDSAESPELILIATGSEVALAMDAAVQLADKGIHTRVVSMPCCELFEQQDDAYRESVLPAKVTARVSIEAGESTYWYRYVGLQGSAIGMNSFGASAPGPVLFEKFGFSADQIVSQASRLLASQA